MRRHARSGEFVCGLAIQDVFFTRPMCAWIGREIRTCLVALCVLGIGIAITPPAHAGHEFPKSCPSGVEFVVYPEEYGWYPCDRWSICTSRRDGAVERLANHPTPESVCRDLHLYVNYGPVRWVLQGNDCVMAPPHHSSFTYTPTRMPFCRDPHDGHLSAIDYWGSGPAPCWYLRCKQDTNRYFIKLAPRTGFPKSSAIVASAEPGKTTNLVAYVYNQKGQSVSSAKVKLEVDVVPNSGGHQHDDDRRHTEYMGKLASGIGTVTQNGKVLTGVTDASGLAFTFTAPLPAGDHKLKATCTDRTCTSQGPDTVWVGIKGLLPIPTASTVYLLENRDGQHPNNHYLTSEAEDRLLRLADRYHQRFPADPVLYLNDASLERGGLFDIYYNFTDANGVQHERNAEGWWKPPHEEHRRGTVIDVRANQAAGAIPSRNHRVFMQFARDIGADAGLHSPGTANQHFHIRLMGVAE